MCRVLIFGGTTEGRILAEYCHEKKIYAWVSVATGYGRSVLLESQYLHIHEKPMTAHEMEGFIGKNGITLVLDATHPYATLASENIRTACNHTGTSCIRIVRESSEDLKPGDQGEGTVLWVSDLEEAVLSLQKKYLEIFLSQQEARSFPPLPNWTPGKNGFLPESFPACP